jgi:hypothetical protein
MVRDNRGKKESTGIAVEALGFFFAPEQKSNILLALSTKPWYVNE